MVARVVERRIVTILFADLVGFTSLSEQLDPEDVTLVQDSYFTLVRETIERHGGLLEKFIGDAVVVVFGAPRVKDDDAARAVRAGLALVAAVDRLGSPLGLDEGALRVRVGVNTGEAVYGEATADRGPVTGDAVNVAARLQAAAAPGSVVVGELTALAVADAAELERLAPLELKGKSQAVPAWRVVSVYDEPSRERALQGLRAPLIGRKSELARLLDVAARLEGRVVVVAPPGVGKTRLLEEVEARVRGRGAAVLRARLRPDLLSPFEPIGQLVRSAIEPAAIASELVAAGVSRSRAVVVAEALQSVLTPSAAGAGAPEERERLFAAWLEGLDAVGGDRPVVWLLEDLHWASLDFLAFLDAAAAERRPAGRIVVGTSRPGLLGSAAEWCARSELLELAPLPDNDVAAFVHALVGNALKDETVERIERAAGGNALFVEELLRMWASSGILVRGDDGWSLTVDASDVILPPTVQAIYAGQLDDLPDAGRTTARRAAVAGRRFPLPGLAALDVADAAAGIEVLARRGLVDGPLGDPTLGPSYVYRHALLRDAGYASLARGERSHLHLRFADWLGSLPAEALPTLSEVIARHYAAALESAPSLAREIGGRGRAEIGATAADWFDRASQVAQQFAAWESATALARRSLDLTAPDETLLRAERTERLAVATRSAVGIAEAELLIREAIDLYRVAGGARSGMSSAGSILGSLLRSQTRFVEAEQLADGLLREIGVADDPATARLQLLRATAALNAWDDYSRSEADARVALATARAHDDDALELDALQLIATITAERGDDSSAEWEEVEQLARSAGRWDLVASAALSHATLRLDDEPDDVLPALADVAELCETYGLVESRGWCDYAAAEACFGGDRWPEAVDFGLRAIALGERHGFVRLMFRSWFVLLPIAHELGRDDLARQAFATFEARRDREPDSPYARVVATAAHLHFAAAGLEPRFVPDVGERLPSFDLDHGGPSWFAAVETLIDTWIEAGETAGALRALDVMRARLARGTPSALARGVESILRARVDVARGDRAAALEEAERGLMLLPRRDGSWAEKARRVLSIDARREVP